VLIRQVRSVAAAEAIDLTGESERGGVEFDGDGLAVLVGGQCGVELAACEDAVVGDADFFDLFEVEEAFAVPQGV
jgi:hypothetical protein